MQFNSEDVYSLSIFFNIDDGILISASIGCELTDPMSTKQKKEGHCQENL